MSTVEERLEAVLGWGLLQPRATVDESVAALRELGPAQAAPVITRHKVRRITRVRVAEAMSRGPETLLRAFDAEIDRLGAPRERRGTDLDGQLADLRARTAALPVRYLKGLGVRSWYPPSWRRDIGDADLWVQDMDDRLRLTAVLRDLGFGYEPGEMPWLKRDVEGVLFGQFRMQHPDPERVDVDIHVGPYSVRYCGLIRFTASEDGGRWRPLADEDNLCGIIGNAAGDCFIEAKMINDLVLAASRPLDLDYVVRTLRAAELSAFTNSIVDATRAACALRADQLDALTALRSDDPPEDVCLLGTDDETRRTRLVTDHARRMFERLTGDRTAAEVVAGDAERAYGTPRSYRLRTSGGIPHRLPELNPWTCVRLAPQPLIRRMSGRHDRVPVRARRTMLADRLELLESDAGDLVRFRDDVFLPTLDYLFCADLVMAEPRLDSGEAGE